MTIFILTRENRYTNEKIIEGAYTSEDRVFNLANELNENSYEWYYDYEYIEVED